jgi:predicted Zn-dependent protease
MVYGALTLSGNTRELLAGIEEVGSDLYIGSMLALDNYGSGRAACGSAARFQRWNRHDAA